MIKSDTRKVVMIKKYILLITLFTTLSAIVPQISTATELGIQSQNSAVETSIETKNTSFVSSITSNQEQTQESSEEEIREKKYQTNTLQQKRETKSPEKKMLREKKTDVLLQATASGETATACEIVKTNITNHIDEFITVYQKKEDNYKKIYLTISELITRLTNKNVDVSELQTANTHLQAQRLELMKALDSYVGAAETVKNMSCTMTASERKEQLAQLRTEKQKYQTELQKVMEIITAELKPTLKQVESNLGTK